jgi:hypothetical protein
LHLPLLAKEKPSVPDKPGEVAPKQVDLGAYASRGQVSGSNALGFALRRVQIELQSQKPVKRGFDNQL